MGMSGLNDSPPPCTGRQDIFFSLEHTECEEAKQICMSCWARPDCLALALTLPRTFGVWGGLVFTNGQVKLSRRKGRPRKGTTTFDQATWDLDEDLVKRLRKRAH